MKTATVRSKRRNARLGAAGGMVSTLLLSRTSADALRELQAAHAGFTRREIVEAALLDAAVRADAFDPSVARLAAEYGLSVSELRYLPRARP